MWKPLVFLTELTQMYLQCCTVQNKGQRTGQSISTHSVPQNTGKAKWAWTFCIFYPYSPTGCTFGAYKAAPLHQMLLLSKATSLFCPWSSSLHHQETKDELKLYKDLQPHYLPYKAAYELSNFAHKAFTSFTAMKYYHNKSSFNLLHDLEYLGGFCIA